MVDKANMSSIPDRVGNLIDRVLEPDPQYEGHGQRYTNVTQEIAQEVQRLTDTELEALVNAHVIAQTPPWKGDPFPEQWATKQLLSHTGQRAIPLLARNLDPESHDRGLQHSLIEILGNIGVPALEVLDSYLFSVTDTHLAKAIVNAFILIGEPAAHLIALALEYPDSQIPNYITERFIVRQHTEGYLTVDLTQAIVASVIEELIVRNPDRPNRFNDKVVADCLQVAVARSPQLRRTIQAQLRDLAFQDDTEVRERALQVAANIDLSDFLQLVRVRAPEAPDVVAEIMYRLGRSEPLPTQKQSLASFTEHLKDLEKRTLDRWDDMARRSKINFWQRFVITSFYVLVSFGLIVVGICLILAFDNSVVQSIGGGLTALTTLAGILTRFWKEPVSDIRSSFIQQASVEATLIGFMTRTGQIRLLFEQNYARGEMSIEELKTYQEMMAETQKQAAQELDLTGRADSRPELQEPDPAS